MIDSDAWNAIVIGLRARPPHAEAVVTIYGALLRIGRRLGASDVGDLASDVLVELLERPEILEYVRAPDTYLRLRLRRRQFVKLRRASIESRALRTIQSSEPRDNAAQVEAALDVGHLITRFRDRLSDEDLELLSLRFWECDDVREVAESIGISYSNAAVRVFRLLGRLRLWMDGES